MAASPHTERIESTTGRVGSTVDAVIDGLPYTLDARIGGSGGTEVWIGHGPKGEVVAVKLVRDADRSPLDSFKHELEAARALDHPAIVRVLDFGESPRGMYVAMDLVQPGVSLATLIARHTQRRMPLSPAIVAYIGISVAEALDHAATRAKLDGLSVRLVHRHLSPGNILIDTEGRVRLVDLGVPASRVAVSPVSGALVRGTPGYLAPEQVRLGTVDERSDVFVLGAILHECATLEAVFARGDPNASMIAVQEKEVRPLADALSAFPPVLSRAIAKAMSKDAADRPADAGEFKVALREAVPTTPGYTEARVALAAQVGTVLRAINQESEARTALIEEGGEQPQPRTLPHDAKGVEPPAAEAVMRGTLGKVAALSSLADAELSVDSADEPTGALLMPPPAMPRAALDDTVPPSDGSASQAAVDRPARVPRVSAPPDASEAVASAPAVRPPPLVTPRTPTAQTPGAPPSPATSDADEPVGHGTPTRLTHTAVPVLSTRSPTRTTTSGSGGGGWLFALSSMLEDPARRRPLVVAFVVVCVALVVVLLATRTTSVHDDALRAIYARGEYKDAEIYYLTHVNDFRYPGPAFELAADAYRRARGEAPVAPAPAEVGARRAAAPAAPAAVAPVAGPVAAPAPAGHTGTGSAAAGETRSLASFAVPSDIPEAAAKTKAEKKARARARKSRETALRALEIDDVVAAEKALRRCVATFDGPACRLHLGLLHARAGELEEASIHFERYLDAWPEAPDAAAIRAALTALPSSPDVE